MVGLSLHIRNHYHLPPQCFHVAITYSPSWPCVPVSSQSHRHTRQLEIQNDFEYQCFPYSKWFVQTGVLLSRTGCLRNKQILYKLHCTSGLNKAEQKLAVDPPPTTICHCKTMYAVYSPMNIKFLTLLTCPYGVFVCGRRHVLNKISSENPG